MAFAFDRINDPDFHRPHRVRWGETDASGFVHLTHYIRMMEETEYAFLRSCGLSVVMSDDRGVLGFPRVTTEIHVHQPARRDAWLDVCLQVAGHDGVKIEYRFEITCQRMAVASGRFVVACCRFPPGQPPRAILVPDFFMERFPIQRSDHPLL